MTKDKIEARLKAAHQDRESALQRLYMLDGVIQDCEYWLGQLASEQAPETEPQP